MPKANKYAPKSSKVSAGASNLVAFVSRSQRKQAVHSPLTIRRVNVGIPLKDTVGSPF